MKKHLAKLLVFYMAFLLVLVSCKTALTYQGPSSNVQGLYRDVGSADTATLASHPWKEIFTDTLLQRLITTGITNNLDLKTAYSRVREAQAYLEQSSLVFYPVLSADAGAGLAGSSSQQATAKTINNRQFQANLTASWEADIWGRLRSSKRANLASLLQANANAHAVQTSLVANIADYYYQLLALDKQLAVTRESIKNWQSTVDVMKDLKKSNVVTGAAIVQSEASKYAAAVMVPELEQTTREMENQLNLLLGNKPGPIERSDIVSQNSITLLQTGVPAQLLANRPDVQAAELSVRQYFELTNVARAYFYPSLTISASGGYLSYSNLFGPGSLVSNLTAGLVQPIFNQGVNRTRLKVAKELQQQALLSFENTVLTAGQEVSNSMYSYQASIRKMDARDNQLINLQKAVDYTQELVRYGFANYTEVLTAQQSLLTAQLNRVNDRLQQLQAIVYLYRSLGGGWN